VKILVTGGTGQIGGALVRALRDRGEAVRCLVRNPDRLANLDGVSGVELAHGDVTDPNSLSAAMDGIEAVFHAAGVVSYEPRMSDRVRAVNVGGTQNMLDAAAAAGVRRFVHTSSIAGLGWVPFGQIGDEETAWNWQGMGLDYMMSKFDAQTLVLTESRLEAIAVMPGIVLGGGDVAGNGLRLLLQLWSGQVPVSPPGGTTASTLSDVVDVHLRALARGRPGQGYIAASWSGPFRELYTRISTELGCAPPRFVIPSWAVQLLSMQRSWVDRRRGTKPRLPMPLARTVVRNRRYSSQKAIDELGFTPSPIEDGIRECWQWARDSGQVT